MSKLIIFSVPGDTATFERALTERAAEFDAVSAEARQQGALHHQFGIGDGEIWVVDEWQTEEAFHAFFADPDLQKFIASIGGDTSQPPEIQVSEAAQSQRF